MAYLNRIAERAIETHSKQRQELADRIISSLDKAMKRAKTKKG